MPLQQIISDTAVRATAEEIAQENTVFREAFRSVDIPERTGDSYDIPVPEDKLGEPTEMQPGSDFDYGREEYDTITLERGYWGSGSRIAEQEVEDNVFSVVEDHVDRHAQAMAEKLDAEAYAVLANAAPAANAVGNDDGSLTFDDVVAGIEGLEARDGGYQPDMAFVGTSAKADVIRYLADRGTDLGDETVETGSIGNFAGLDFMYSNTGLLPSNDAILVDSDFFGYEGVWNGVDTDSEEDFDTRSTKLQIFAEMDWETAHAPAAIRVQG
jgi:hypothetical protein